MGRGGRAGTQGILLQSDVAIHAESRAIVQPAFRVENLRQHLASFAVTAQRMANILYGTGGRPLEVMVRSLPPLLRSSSLPALLECFGNGGGASKSGTGSNYEWSTWFVVQQWRV